MKIHPWWLVAALVLGTSSIGCKGKDKASASGLQPTCASSAAAYGKVLGASFAKQFPDKPDAATNIEASVVASCEGDQWPANVLGCLSATKGRDTMMEACINSLPKELQTKMEDAIKARMATP